MSSYETFQVQVSWSDDDILSKENSSNGAVLFIHTVQAGTLAGAVWVGRLIIKDNGKLQKWMEKDFGFSIVSPFGIHY